MVLIRPAFFIIMHLECVVLIILSHFGLQQMINPAPTLMVGELPAKGQPYQIVRIIEYLIPYSPNKAAKTRRGNSSSLKQEDSLEITPANIESLFTLTRTTTCKPKIFTHFLVKVRLHNENICTGALISSRLVLSSSSCLPKRAMPKNYKIQAARNHIYGVDKIIVGPVENLALLVLKEAIRDAAIQPVQLCNTSLKRLDNVTMYMSKKRLSFLRTQIIANGVCKRSYGQDENAYITAGMLCAQNTAKSLDCQTAKGDLLLHQDRLCGINIYGSHCVNGSVNGDLYANIFKAREYLQRMIKQFV